MPAPGAFARRLQGLLRRREDQLFFALCGVVGALGALVGEGFRRALFGLWELLFGGSDLATSLGGRPVLFVLATTTLGGLAAGAVLHLFRREAGTGHGVPDVMEVVVLGRRSLRLRPVLKRAAAAFLGIASGGSVGREGPIIQVTTSVSARLGSLLNLSEESYRILTAAGVAAGVAGAYHTPLAGVLFVVEIVVGAVNMRVLGAAGIAAIGAWVTGDVLGFHHGAFFAPWRPFGAAAAGAAVPPPLFEIRSPWEYGAHAALGLLCGVVAPAFMTALSGAARLFAASRLPIPARTALGGLAVGAIGLARPEVFGNGYETARQILHETPPPALLAALAILKPVATALTVGSGVPGGVFTPTLMIGAASGALFGHGLRAAFGDAVGGPASYAQLGLAGLLAGTMHAPLLATVMTVELVDDHRFAVPLLLTSFVARSVARRIKKGSIYTEELLRKGVGVEGSLQERMLRSLKVSDLLRSDVALVPQSEPLAGVVRRFSETRALHLYVGDPAGRLTGAIDLHDVKGALSDGGAASAVIAADLSKEIPTAFPDESIVEVNRRLWMQDVGHLPVVASEGDRTFLGVVTRRDILGAVDRQILRQNVLMAPILSEDRAAPDWFELPPGGRLEGVRVPPQLYGRRVGESDLGRRFGVQILAITKTDRRGVERRLLPRADVVLEAGDRLVVIGPTEAVDRLLRAEIDPELPPPAPPAA